MANGLHDMDSNGVAALFLTPGTQMINGSKHISIRDGEQTVIDDYALIQKKDRAGSDGKNIMCPHCESVRRIYHLAWSELTCQSCKTSVPKYNGWLIDQLDTWKTPR
jgi:ribosomal protein S27E